MSKESAKKIISVFKWFYIIGGVLIIALSLLFFMNSNADFMNEIVKSYKIDVEGVNPVTVIGIVMVISGIINLIEAWLFSRVTKDGKKSTLLMILLIISIASAIYTVITAFNVSNIISLLTNVLVFAAVLKLRSEN